MVWPKQYVCPVLVLAQYSVMRLLPGHPVKITLDGCLVRVMPAGHGVEAELWWPRSLVELECRFWNSRVGSATRAIGSLARTVWNVERGRW